ncbi:MAG: FliH/SctL family protein [Candidatus Solibacter sp.]
MSSKIHPPDSPGVKPVVWRQLHAAGSARSAERENVPDSRENLAAMQAQAEQRVREAHAVGKREGEAQGKQRAAVEIQPALDRLARAVDEIGGLRARLRAEAEADLVQLSLAIARRILRRELAMDPDALHGLILGALEKLAGQEISRVRVHPSHAAALTECLRQRSGGAKVEILADSSRAIGEVVFETQRGNLDASVESQLQEIERGLADRLRRQV